MKKARNIFAAVSLIIFLPLLWHALMPLSLCWLQWDQIGLGAVIVFLLGCITLGMSFDL